MVTHAWHRAIYSLIHQYWSKCIHPPHLCNCMDISLQHTFASRTTLFGWACTTRQHRHKLAARRYSISRCRIFPASAPIFLALTNIPRLCTNISTRPTNIFASAIFIASAPIFLTYAPIFLASAPISSPLHHTYVHIMPYDSLCDFALTIAFIGCHAAQCA